MSPYLFVVLQLVIVLAQARAKSQMDPAASIPQIAEAHAQTELAAALRASFLHQMPPGVTSLI